MRPGRIGVTGLIVAALATLPPQVPAGAAEAAGGGEVRVDFEDFLAGGLPPAFATGLTGKGGPVRWVVVEDQSAPEGPKVLAETSRDRTSDRFPLATLEGFAARDVGVGVRFKPISGSVDRAAGVMVRVVDEDNYYIARANALEGNVRLYKVVKGRRQQLAGVDVPVPARRWQELGLRAEGDRLAVSLDGRELFGATDRTFAQAGRVGLWTKADSLTHFDRLVARRLR